MELVKKAWCINRSIYKEPWFVPQDIVYADTRGKAKTELLDLIKYDEFETYDGSPVDFLTFKISRAKDYDKYLLNGEVMTLRDIEYQRMVTKRNTEVDKLVDENPNGFAYVKKGGIYWGPNHCGYTEYNHKAGIYPIEEAASIVKGSSLDRHESMVVIDIDEHNAMLQEKIDDLKSRFL